jgi:steroid 5-alpha reductase family enzyme
MDLSVTATAAAGAGVLMGLTWPLSLLLRDASIADVAWGLVFIVIAWAVYAAGAGTDAMLVAVVVVSAWGIRLAAHIGLRNHGHGEDRRYTAMRERRPASFWIWSLFGVFLLQGLIALIVSLPLQSLAADDGASLGPLAWVGLTVALLGLAFEAAGDAQLSAFKADRANRGKVMDRGLWRYTRHPNYFAATPSSGGECGFSPWVRVRKSGPWSHQRLPAPPAASFLRSLCFEFCSRAERARRSCT